MTVKRYHQHRNSNSNRRGADRVLEHMTVDNVLSVTPDTTGAPPNNPMAEAAVIGR